jgi:ApaG protein
MVKATTEGISVAVLTEFEPDYSSPLQNHFVFTYHISIENNSSNTVQLLRRHWNIVDSNTEFREVAGEGVVGTQPILEPGEKYQYVSGCNIKTTMGKMYGFYTMERILDGKQFNVEIPEFMMIVPYLNN